MLLLTTVTFGGGDSVGIFDHLPDDEGELLRHRAQEILKIPRDKRIPLLVQEIKRLVTARRSQVWAADPDGLAALLSKERPALVEVVLRALPAGTAEAVRKHLPQGNGRVKLEREVNPQILHLIRYRLEEALANGGPRRPGFKFSDLLLLKSREVLTVCDRLGARALAQALAGLPPEAREDFLGRLRPDQRQLAARAATGAAARALNPDDARTLLDLYGAQKEPVDALRSAGAQRLARAALAQSPEFAARLVERHPGAFGQLLLRWIREERPRVSGRMDGGRADVVAELDRLEQKGVIDRPVRLPPPPKAHPASPYGPHSLDKPHLPGGRVLVPAPRPSSSGAHERPRSGGHPVPPRSGAHPVPPGGAHKRPSGPHRSAPPVPAPAPAPEVDRRWRDPIAARGARRAGVPAAAPPAERKRDPMAEREARRAGAGRLSAGPSPGPGPGRRPGTGTGSSGGVGGRAGPLPRKVVKARPEDLPRTEEGEVATLPGNIRRAAVQKPPVSGELTSVQRPPRPGRPSGRGPRGGSG